MRISRNIKKTEWPSKPPLKTWNREVKQLSDKRLVKTIKALLEAQNAKESSAWTYASLAVSELYIRNWGKKHLTKVGDLRVAISDVTTLCFSSGWYALETAGIAKGKKKKKIIHPYAFSETAKAVIQQWEESRTSKSLEAFLQSHVEKENLDYLKSHTIKYLSPKKVHKHLVTFEDGKILIGGKIPKDALYIFVLENEPKRLLAGIKKTGSFHHTSFVAGAPVACAGEFEIEDGKIISILLRSGHYRPTEEHGEVLHKFLAQKENLGPKIMSRLEVEPYQN